MDKYPEYTSCPGAHKGWIEYHWRQCNRPWKLLTIETDGPRSLLTPNDEDRLNVVWPKYNIRSFTGLIHIHTAMEIVGLIHLAYNAGKDEGNKQKLQEIRKTLGIV